MELQENILKKYQETFPNETYAKISKKTGIQATRVFRLFNGQEMKLKEYLSFKKVIEGNQVRSPYAISNEVFDQLPEGTQKEIYLMIQYQANLCKQTQNAHRPMMYKQGA